MINKIKKLLGKLNEDWLTLEDKLVKIGVLSYRFQTKGALPQVLEDKLIDFVEDAKEDIKDVIKRWLSEHALKDQASELGVDYHDLKERFSENYDISTLDNIYAQMRMSVEPDGEGTVTVDDKLLKDLNNLIGGVRYFGEYIDCGDVEMFIENHIEEEEYEGEEGEEPYTYHYFEMDDDYEDLIDFLIEMKEGQVSQDDDFLRLANNMVEAIKELEQALVSYDTKDIILKFDRLKDLNHANGNLLNDYGDVDWDEINDKIADEVESLTKKVKA